MVMDYVNYITFEQIFSGKGGIRMRRLVKSHFSKSCLGTVFLLLCAALLGLLFAHFSSIRYQVGGASGTLTSADVTFSLVFLVFALLFHFVCGLCAMPGSITGLTLLSILTIGGGLAGFLGYAYLLGPVQSLYFVLIAPIVPLLESLFGMNIFENADILFVLLPALVMLAKFACFGAGLHLHGRPELLERSLRRIDRFYEYRRPVEEETLDQKSA